MRKIGLKAMTAPQLVKQFETLGLEQDDALLGDEIARFNCLFDQLEAVEAALKALHGDQRKELLGLFNHRNAQVRLNAAKATLAVAPQAARHLLRAIADSHEHPQAADAGMTIRMLERGIYKPT